MAQHRSSELRRLLIVGAAAVLAGCGKAGGPQFKAIDITGADYAGELELPDVDGRMRRLSEFKGKVAVVFFGFTHCPDVCPTTLLELAAVRKALGSQGDQLQGIFVTVDPERDTPQVLKAYVGNFGADFVALRGSPEQTRAVAKHFKVHYAKVPGTTEGSYTMDHTAGSYVFDRQGRIRLFTRHGGGAEALQHDVKILLDES
jgi:protein SCO1/2